MQLEIETLCQCGFTIQHLSDSEFQCLTDLSEVTFRARLHSTAQTTSSELIRYIEQWIAGGGSVLVERVRHFTDGTCQPVEISSFSDPECGTTTESPTTDATESPTESPTSDDTESPTQAVQSDNSAAIIGGVVVAVVLIIAVAITVIVIVILVLKNRRASITLQKEG